jgi:hypothetical protein
MAAASIGGSVGDRVRADRAVDVVRLRLTGFISRPPRDSAIATRREIRTALRSRITTAPTDPRGERKEPKHRYTRRVVKTVRTSILLMIATLGPMVGWAASSQPVFKIYVEHAGVYQVPFERLIEVGLAQPVATAGIGLRNLGQPVPIWIEDGGDGVFGAGDRLLFVGDVLRGDTSYLDPYSRFNCYVLDVEDEMPWHGETRPPDAGSAPGSAALVARHHLEPDRVMVRFRTQPDQPEEEWYWERLSVADRKPFSQRLTVNELVRQRISGGPVAAFADALAESLRSTDGPSEASTIRSQLDAVFGQTPAESTSVSIRFGTRGWSRPMHAERAALPDHQIEVLINGTLVGTDSWDGTDHHVYELDVPSDLFADGDNELTLIVPKRAYPDSGDLVVDVVLLNWIELEYPRAARVSDEQLRLGLADPLAGRRVELAAETRRTVDLYLPDGVRIRGEGGVVAVELPSHADEFSVLSSDAAAAPNEIVLDRPSDLATADHQADYIMITHRSLSAGANRLAEFHRSRGLTVEVVDVQMPSRTSSSMHTVTGALRRRASCCSSETRAGTSRTQRPMTPTTPTGPTVRARTADSGRTEAPLTRKVPSSITETWSRRRAT